MTRTLALVTVFLKHFWPFLIGAGLLVFAVAWAISDPGGLTLVLAFFISFAVIVLLFRVLKKELHGEI